MIPPSATGTLFRSALCAILVTLSGASAISAPDATPTPKPKPGDSLILSSADFKDATLGDVLETCSNRSGLNFVASKKWLDLKVPDASLKNASVFSIITAMAGNQSILSSSQYADGKLATSCYFVGGNGPPISMPDPTLSRKVLNKIVDSVNLHDISLEEYVRQISRLTGENIIVSNGDHIIPRIRLKNVTLMTALEAAMVAISQPFDVSVFSCNLPGESPIIRIFLKKESPATESSSPEESAPSPAPKPSQPVPVPSQPDSAGFPIPTQEIVISSAVSGYTVYPGIYYGYPFTGIWAAGRFPCYRPLISGHGSCRPPGR